MQCPFRSTLYAHDISVLDSFSASQDRSVHRAPAAHTPPAAARRNPGPGCRVPSVGPRPRNNGSSGAEKNARLHIVPRRSVRRSADPITISIASDDAFSVATNQRQINRYRYIVDSKLQYFRGKSLAANSSSSSSCVSCVQKLFLDANRISICLNF